MLRSASHCDIENNTKFIVSLLKSILTHIISKKLLQNLYVQNASFSTRSAKLLQQLHSLLVDESFEVKSILVKKLVSCMSCDKASDNTSSTTSSNHFG